MAFVIVGRDLFRCKISAGAKWYNEAVRTNTKGLHDNWPPLYNDLSSAWVILVIENSGRDPAERGEDYPVTFTSKALVSNWKNKAHACATVHNGRKSYEVALNKWQMHGQEV